MNAKIMAEVLAEHYESGTEFTGIGGSWIAGCICAWNSNAQQTYGMAKVAHARHVSEHLSAAGFGLVADATDRVGKRYAKLHQMLRGELQAQAWDRGMGDQLKLLKAGPGYEMGNPYRRHP